MTWDGLSRVWLHVTDAEAFALAMGVVAQPVKDQCEQLLREPDATLKKNQDKPLARRGTKGNPKASRTASQIAVD